MYGEDFTPFGQELKAKREASGRRGAGAVHAEGEGQEIVDEADGDVIVEEAIVDENL